VSTQIQNKTMTDEAERNADVPTTMNVSARLLLTPLIEKCSVGTSDNENKDGLVSIVRKRT
jgi:hypothetical protein